MHSRLNCLTELIDVTRGRVPDDLTGRAVKILERAGQRLRWGEQTVVALAGSTGSGKSSLMNALVGSDVAEVGVLRPTTAETLAVSCGNTNAELLDWLQIKHRREVPVGQNGFGGMVLLDLPDHDSMVSAHRAEVDRMVPVVDQLIWVLDLQKYADAAVHHGYLKPLSRHGEVMVVVLNQVDRIRAADLDDCLAHLGQLLDSDGLKDVPLFATSTMTRTGVDALWEHLANVVAGKRAARTRLSVELDQLAEQFDETCRVGLEEPSDEDVEVLEVGLAEVAGVPRMIDVAAETIRYRGALATGWPMTRWMHRLRSDPLKRFRTAGNGFTPDRGPVAMAQLRTTLRQFSDAVGNGLGEDWQRALEEACRRDHDLLPDLLAEAIAATDLGFSRNPGWWRAVRGIQWFLLAVAMLGLGWLLANLLLAWVDLPGLVAPGDGGGMNIPALLIIGGVGGGLLFSFLSRGLVAAGERSGIRQVARRLRAAVGKVGREHVVAPLTAELGRLAEARRLIRGLRG